MASSDRKALNAWDDDDWTKSADKLSLQASAWSLGPADSRAPGSASETNTGAASSAPKITRAQREAQHREENQRIWAEANAPPQFSFLDASTTGVPVSDAFRPVRVLARTPAAPSTPAPALARRPAASPADLSDADDTSSAADQRDSPPPLSFEERQAKLAREREEKQRRYEEARAKIFGAANPAATATAATPPASAPASGAASPVQRGRGGARARGGRGRGPQRQNSGFEDREQVLAGSTAGAHSADGTSSPRGGRRGRMQGSIAPGLGGSRQAAKEAGTGAGTGMLHAERAPRVPEAGNRGGFAGRRGRGGRGGRGPAPGGGVSLV